MNARIAIPADDDLLRSIVMHPAVREGNAHDGAPDFEPTKYTAHSNSFAVIVEAEKPLGCFLAHAIERGAYSIHTNLLPTCRGGRAIEAAAEALEYAFVRTDAERLVTSVPECNPQALWFAHAMGFRNTYKRKATWLKNGVLHDCQHLAMDIDDWVLRLTMCDLGHTFHDALAAKGVHIDHGLDPVHDAYVGAAWAMTAAERLEKGLVLYNRWARAAGFQPYEILSSEPLRIDIGSCVLRATGHDFIVE